MGSRVLVLEDDAVLARNLGRLLLREGYEVHTASCVAEFVHLAAQQSFDSVLLDRSLPDGDGIEAWSRVRGGHPEARAVVITAVDGDEVVQRARDNGIDAVFAKPVDLPSLLRQLAGDGQIGSGAPAR